MNNFLLTIAILAQLTGLTLPQVLVEDLYILPSYDEANFLELKAEKVVHHYPTINKQVGPRALNLDWGPQDLQAKAAIIADAATGQILFEKNSQASIPIASITKLMTSLVFMDNNPGWDSKYEIKTDENYLIGAKLQIETGQQLTTHDLLRVTLVGSANNTAKALSRSTGMSDNEFAQAMNNKATELGLENSKFIEPTGLEDGNKSSAADLAKIFRTVIKYKPLRDAISLEKHAMEVPPDNHFHEIKSTNKLLNDDEVNVIGGKTGFTYEADYCLITLATDKDGHEIIVATLGLPTETARDVENKELIKWAYNNYTWD